MSESYFAGPAEDPDRYELTELRSRGGEGELWGGWVRAGGQQLPVAVKVFHPGSHVPLAQLADRVRAQSEILRSIEHPNLIKVRESFLGPAFHPAGQADPGTQSLFLVMNWAPGESLESWVARNPQRDPLQVARIVSRLAAGVDELHSGRSTGGSAVLHRDIKPANVMVNGDEVRLVDFGLARFASSSFETVAGTPAYLAPEIMTGATPTAASDRFGVAAVAYFLFTGSPPNMTDPNAMRAALAAVPGIADREGLGSHLLSMLHPDPMRRPTNVIEWSQGLSLGTVSQSFNSLPPTMATPTVSGPTVARSPEQDYAYAPPAYAPPAYGPPTYTGTTMLQPSVPRDSGNRGLLIGAVAAGLILVLGAIAFALTSGDDAGGDTDLASSSESTATTESTTTSTSSTSTSTSTTTTTTTPTPTSLPDSPGQIAAPETIQFLSDFRPVAYTGGFNSGQARLSGEIYTRSVLVDPNYRSPGYVEYDLGRKFARLQARLGLSDDADSASVMKIEVFADGETIFDQTARLGDSLVLNVDITNRLRLRLQVTEISENTTDSDAVFGDIKIVPKQ